MNARLVLIGKLLGGAILIALLVTLLGMPGVTPAHAQIGEVDPHTPVQSPPLRQGGLDYDVLLASATSEVNILSVINPDDRTRITPTTIQPYQYMAQLLFEYPPDPISGDPAPVRICSGVFIGPLTVATAGHCVYDQHYGWTNRVIVTPGLDGDGASAPYGSAEAVLSYTTDGWRHSGDVLYDYGAVRLDASATIGYSTGWMEYGYFSDDYMNNAMSAAVNVSGYPLDKDAECEQTASCLWTDSGSLTGFTDAVLSYNVDTDMGDAGEDGAPLWMEDNGQYHMLGIHLFDNGSGPTGCETGSNCGLRISPEVAINLTTWSDLEPVSDCHELTRTHTGEGSNPLASPTKTAGCATGEYIASTVIELTATPAVHWLMGSWVGTNDDLSTETTNTATMPDSDHTVTVNYLPVPCYALNVTTNPIEGGSLTFYPPSTCPGGYYDGTDVIIVAQPNPGYGLLGWTGSVTETSTYISITMDADYTITATFVPALSGGEYDDQDPAFLYTPTPNPPPIIPGWTDYDYLSGTYNTTLHLSYQAGNSTEVTIYGSGFDLYHSIAPNYGTVDVFLDNDIIPLATINMYYSSVYRQRVWSSPPIPPGVHTLRFVHSTGSFIDIDGLIVVPVLDSLPPSPITDLSGAPGVNPGDVVLSWTALGDDLNGGTVTQYDVRYSSTAITSEDDWNAATAITANLPVPLASGSPQTMSITNLMPGDTYYFAVRARDEADNQGGLSNSPAVMAKPITPFNEGIYDDNNINILYTGNWRYYPVINGYYLQTDHLSLSLNNSAVFGFNGRSFKLYYTAAFNRGKMDVYIDNVWVETINMYSPSTLYQRQWISPPQALGTHTVKLVHLSGPYVDVDAIAVLDSILPAPILNLAANPGATPGSVQLSWDAVGDDYLNGTAQSYLVRYSTAPINSESVWNAATPVTIGIPTPGPFGTPESMIVNALDPFTRYYFSVRARDEANNQGGLSNSPGTNPTMITPLEEGMHDDNNIDILYAGNWKYYPVISGYYQLTDHLSQSIGDTAVFAFRGESFTLYYTAAFNRGKVDVFIDGKWLTTLNFYSPSTLYQRQWTSPVQLYGVHTVKLVHLGGTYVDVDAIVIPDSLAPAAITDLQAVSGSEAGSVLLTWTAVGDNDMSGTAKTYQVRYSTSIIDSVDAWNAATPVASGIPTPQPAGSSESMLVTGLNPANTFYFSVRAEDDLAPVPHLGDLSNSPHAQPTIITPFEEGIYDNNNTNIIYSGGWKYYPSLNGPYLRTDHLSLSLGDRALFVFHGKTFILYYTSAANRGKMDVYINDVWVGTVNMYSSSVLYQRKWTCPAQPMGVYTVKLVHLSGPYVDVDAIAVPDSISPAPITDLAAAPGSAVGTVNLAWTAVGDDGLVGTAKSYLVRYSTAPINSEAAWTAATPVTTGIPTPKPSGGSETMTLTGINPFAAYYYAVRAQDVALNMGDLSNSPSAQAKPPNVLNAGTHDDQSADILYFGPWRSYPSIYRPYMNSLHLSYTTGDQALFIINGTGFTLTHTGYVNRGTVDVYVDGVKMTTMNQYTTTLIYQKTWTYPSSCLPTACPSLSAGQHTIRLVHAGGSYIDVDAITVIP